MDPALVKEYYGFGKCKENTSSNYQMSATRYKEADSTLGSLVDKIRRILENVFAK